MGFLCAPSGAHKKKNPIGVLLRVRNKYYEKMIFIWNRGVVLYMNYINRLESLSNRLKN